MTTLSALRIDDIAALSRGVLRRAGFGDAHAAAITRMLQTCQVDDCQSHGLFRLFMCVETMRLGTMAADAAPVFDDRDDAVVRVDAGGAMSRLAAHAALPRLAEKARAFGIAALAINRCHHFSALWPEVERLAADGLAAIAMVPSHAWVAPAGGTRGALGTNPLAFAWPRRGAPPFVFDFATSAFARGEIELHRRAGRPLPEGVAIDADGRPTTDPTAALDGAMLTFGGHKGSALSIMIELLAGPLIDDLTSLESLAAADGKSGAPFHGQLILAFDPDRLSGGRLAENDARATRLFDEILGQGARLPSERRYAARARNLERGYVEISADLHRDLQDLI
ncbi:MAG: Ldh family oxidoreductase [Pseudomonadota bacterium]